MDRPEDFTLTSSPEAALIVSHGRQAALIMAADEFAFGVALLRNTVQETNYGALVASEPEDENIISEACSRRDRGFLFIARAAGIGKGHVLRQAAEAHWDSLFPVTEDYANYSFADVTARDVARVSARIANDEVVAAARLIFDMSDPAIAPEYAMEVLRGD